MYGGTHTLKRYRLNKQRVIHTNGLTERRYTHERINIQREMYTEGAYMRRGYTYEKTNIRKRYIDRGNIHLKERIYEKIFNRVYVGQKIHRVEY